MVETLPCLYTDTSELNIDLNIYMKICQEPVQSAEAIREYLYNECKSRKPFATLEDARFKESPRAQRLEIGDVSAFTLFDMSALFDPTVVDDDIPNSMFDDLVVPPEVQEIYSADSDYDDNVKKDIMERFFPIAEDETPNLSNIENTFGSVKNEQVVLKDSQISNLGVVDPFQDVAQSPIMVDLGDVFSDEEISAQTDNAEDIFKSMTLGSVEFADFGLPPTDFGSDVAQSEEPPVAEENKGVIEDEKESLENAGGVQNEDAEDSSEDEDDEDNWVEEDSEDTEEEEEEETVEDAEESDEDEDDEDEWVEEDDEYEDEDEEDEDSDEEEDYEDDISDSEEDVVNEAPITQPVVQEQPKVVVQPVQPPVQKRENTVTPEAQVNTDRRYTILERMQKAKQRQMEAERKNETLGIRDGIRPTQPTVPSAKTVINTDEKVAQKPVDQKKGDVASKRQQPTPSEFEDLGIDAGMFESHPTRVVQQPIKKSVPIQQKTSETTMVAKKPSNAPPKQEPIVEEEPKDIRDFLRKHPNSTISFVRQYFTQKQIDIALRNNRIVKRKDVLKIM